MRKNTVAEAMPIVKRVEFIVKFEFIKTALDKNVEIYIVYIATLEIIKVYPLRAPLLAMLQ